MIRRTLDLRSWEGAQKIVRDWEVNGIDTVIGLEIAFERFLEDHRVNYSAPDTTAKHRRMKTMMLDFFGDRAIKSLTVDEIAEFRESWTFGPTTAINTINRLRAFFNFCIDRDWVEKNPASKLKLPKILEIERKPYEAEELVKIWQAVDEFPNWGIYGTHTRERLRAFITVLRWTGLRISDVVRLEWSSIKEGQITIRTTKNKKRVSIPLHPSVEVALEAMSKGQYIFWSGEGTLKSGINAWERTMKRLSKIAKFRVHPHRFRHNFATELLSKGVPVSEVAAILGNSPKIVEKVYAQWIDGRQQAVNAAVRAAWS
jgi:integrase